MGRRVTRRAARTPSRRAAGRRRRDLPRRALYCAGTHSKHLPWYLNEAWQYSSPSIEHVTCCEPASSAAKLATMNGGTVDWIVVQMHQCALSWSTDNGCDAGIRQAWVPLSTSTRWTWW